MPKVTEAHLEARKQQIIDAAAASFARKGFHQTTMADICTEADLSPGAVYRYFTSKEDIIAAMVDERRREGVAMIEAVRRERHETLAVLDELAELFFSRLGDVQGCALDIDLWAEAQANQRVRDALQLDSNEISESFTEIIRHAQSHGEVNPGLDPRAVAHVMCSFFYGLILQKSIDPSVDVWPYVDAIKAMMGGTFWLGANAQKGGSHAEFRN
jgi:AcrR family transcriptional regulator